MYMRNFTIEAPFACLVIEKVQRFRAFGPSAAVSRAIQHFDSGGSHIWVFNRRGVIIFCHPSRVERNDVRAGHYIVLGRLGDHLLVLALAMNVLSGLLTRLVGLRRPLDE